MKTKISFFINFFCCSLVAFLLCFGSGISFGYEWTKTFGGSAEDMGLSVQQTIDGGYIVAGHTLSFGTGQSDVYVIKTDADGNELWSKTFGGSSVDGATTVQQTTDGGYIIAGTTYSFGEGGPADFYLVKTDANGNELWSKTFGDANSDWTNAAQQTSDGGYIILGHTGPPNAHGDLLLIKTDSNGNEIWSKTFGPAVFRWRGSVVASNFSSAHRVIDVLGYYYPDGELLYTAVNPCRIADTRKTSAGIIDADTQRNFRVFGSGSTISAQGGNSAGCSSPLGRALRRPHQHGGGDPTGKGNLQAFPVDAGAGAGLSVNYNTIDTNLANAGTVKTVTGSGPDISVASNFSLAHTVIDLLGYYYPDGDLLYTAVPPCRIVDTRKAGGLIGASTQRDFHVYGSGSTINAQGGNSAGCSAPMGEPLAAQINMVAVNPTGKGNLQAYAVGAGPGAGLSVNYNTIDTNLANAGTVKTVTGAGPDISVASNFSSAHTVIDVLGYYYPAP